MLDALDRMILGLNIAAIILMIIPTVLVLRSSAPHRVPFLEMMIGGTVWGISSTFQILRLVPPDVVDGLRTLGWLLLLSGWVILVLKYPRPLSVVERKSPHLVSAAVHVPLLIIGILRVTTRTMFYMEEIGGRYVLQKGPLFFISLGFGYGYVLFAMAKLWRDARESDEPVVQMQAALLFAAGLPSLLLNIIEIVFLPTRSAITSVGFCVTGALIGVSILKYRMFEVQRLFRRGMSVGLVSVIAGTMFKLFEELTEAFVQSFLPAVGSVPPIVAVLVVAVLFVPLHRATLRVSHGIFPRIQTLSYRVAELREQGLSTEHLNELLARINAFQDAGETRRARRLLDVMEAEMVLLEADQEESLP